ncbi:MAG TPA: UDP-3-O-(3-hydroxymyristoyl)glucosamine N-acyltransferase [Hyphomonadaceae bacterium]|nr:UDP-3-O-(3-hydroxymyristoyl)glucosamine N-acyltransferase [Hyphomonadaceae bacterium]HPN06809.1 UDP-3-O-(3-hydroxymyristoyl)glucosamine N-acyltransferase [Hyphomonadaceae bacterium]
MLDPRFYAVERPLTALDIAAIVGAEKIRGDAGRSVSSLAPASLAGRHDLTFQEGSAGAAELRAVGIILASPEAAGLIPDGPAVIEVRHARSAFAKAAAKLAALRQFERGQVAVHTAAKISDSAILEPGVVVGANAAIGAGVYVGANAVIGPGVQIGARTTIGANASIRCALIGDGVRIFPGAVIGETGFGLAAGGSGAALTPHFGRVIMQNGVSLGANSCIDRGLLEDTVIGERTHIDNLCHIGHNCRIGSHVVMAAFAGISGSSTVGDGAQFGGRVGLKDHVHVGKGARIAAGAAVLSDVPAGETWAGYPSKPIRTWMRELAWLARSAQKRSSKDD